MRGLSVASGHSLSGLMQLYESSFLRLQRLLPEWPLPFSEAVSEVAGDRALHVELLEAARYTSVLRLTYRFADQCQPDLVVKIYHDAQMAEALSVGDYSRCDVLRELDLQADSTVHQLWPANLLMDKWLDYLLQKGHGFAGANRPRSPQMVKNAPHS